MDFFNVGIFSYSKLEISIWNIPHFDTPVNPTALPHNCSEFVISTQIPHFNTSDDFMFKWRIFGAEKEWRLCWSDVLRSGVWGSEGYPIVSPFLMDIRISFTFVEHVLKIRIFKLKYAFPKTRSKMCNQVKIHHLKLKKCRMSNFLTKITWIILFYLSKSILICLILEKSETSKLFLSDYSHTFFGLTKRNINWRQQHFKTNIILRQISLRQFYL